MEPENGPLEEDTVFFSETDIFRFHIGFPGCNRPSFLLSPFNFRQGNEYTFTVLSLRHMSITLNALADAPFVPYRAKVHSYSSDVVKPDGVDELVLTPGP